MPIWSWRRSPSCRPLSTCVWSRALRNERRCYVSDHTIHVAGRPRSEGLDFERLAQALLELLSKMPVAERRRLAARGEKVLKDAEKEGGDQPPTVEGAA